MPESVCLAVFSNGERCDRVLQDYNKYCTRHRREKREGVPFTPHEYKPNKTDDEMVQHILKNVRHKWNEELSSPCWLWQKHLDLDGYGHTTRNNKQVKVMKVAKKLIHGVEAGPGLLLRHLCRNQRDCVNPAHLRVGTHKENMEDKIRDGNSLRGTKNRSTKLSEVQVLNIYSRSLAGEKYAVLAREFGLSSAETIRHIRLKKNWKWLTDQADTAFAMLTGRSYDYAHTH